MPSRYLQNNSIKNNCHLLLYSFVFSTMDTMFDFIVIGSGFGGSVSALRLAEKGYSVAVLEQGKRYHTKDFPKTNWNFRKYFWLPKIGFYGIQALTQLKNVFILHGAGVGGGSLVYANTLLTPNDEVLNSSSWGRPNWKETILPFYDLAKKMLGATPSQCLTKADEILKECAKEIGREDTFRVNDVGIYFGKEGQTVSDPYFDGDGPERTGCVFCGGCLVGCRYDSKNTLDKNYLFLAEKLGVQIIPESQVVDVSQGADGEYILKTKRTTGIFSRKKSYSAKNVVFSGGVMGTVKLLLKCKENGSLPGLSNQLGDFVRTNSEALVGSRAKSRDIDYSKGISITSGVYADEQTYIETVRYGKGQDAMALLNTILVGGYKNVPRQILFFIAVLRHPVQFIRILNPFGWARSTTVLLVMQKIDNYMRFTYRRRWWRFGAKSMNSYWKTEKRVPSYIPIANDFARRFAEKTNGIPGSVLPEVLFNTGSTAHILGGCVMSEKKDRGVVGFDGKIHGYDNLYVVDGSIVPVNLGVNPSLTITALSEYIMDQIPVKDQSAL